MSGPGERAAEREGHLFVVVFAILAADWFVTQKVRLRVQPSLQYGL
jgi:hypothetical protein